MSEPSIVQSPITELLQNEALDHQSTVDKLLPLIYDELRAMARRQLFKERSNHTLGTTGLVNEAYLKLANNPAISSKGRAYFFAAAANTMREILVDYARQRNRQKRGANAPHTSLKTENMQINDFAGDILDLNDALDKLGTLNPRHVQVVECRFFSGLSVEETALALDISARTVKQDWAIAKAWLYRKLNHDH